MTRYLRMLFLGLTCLGLSGCFSAVTHGIGAVERGLAVGDDFRAWKQQMPPIPAGKGRIIVYPGGGRSFVYETTGVGKGGEQLFVVDRDVCEVLGRSFVFLDLPPGPHELSAENVSKAFGYQKGRNSLKLEISPAAVTYVRIEKDSGGPLSRNHYLPKIVDGAAADAELKDWPLYKDGLKCRLNKAEDRPA